VAATRGSAGIDARPTILAGAAELNEKKANDSRRQNPDRPAGKTFAEMCALCTQDHRISAYRSDRPCGAIGVVAVKQAARIKIESSDRTQ
jgi:hypothetical protein